jgi:hypothetical protein
MKLKKLSYSFGLRIFTILILLGTPAAFAGKVLASEPALATLEPGGLRNIEHNLPVNIVFIGYEPGGGAQPVNEAAFRAGLPNIYRAINRIPSLYGERQFTGLTYNYEYNIVFADTAYEDAFFQYLSGIAQPQPRTIYQNIYNAQNTNVLNVGQNHWIDAPSVEKWLAANTQPLLGVDTAQYTLFLINWYGRADFKFHIYSKIDEPDPDTGYNVGLVEDAYKTMAWGGTTPDDEESGLGSLHRIWFYDLSAGPDHWAGNYLQDLPDITGDNRLDYRMPPIWEYGNLTAYRPFNDLSGDLSKVTRYIAIDSIFTPSPIYNPALSAPKLPTNIQLDVNFYQGDAAVDARTLLSPAVLNDEVSELQPDNSFTTEIGDHPLTNRAAAAYDCWLAGFTPPYNGDTTCYGNRLPPSPWANLYLYNRDHLFQFIEGDPDYEIPIFIYNTDATEFRSPFYLGLADDNWKDGTQSYIFAFTDRAIRSVGYGMSYVTIHEVGHHLGLSHPRDGYDYETNQFFSQNRGQFFFVGSGDQVNSIMGQTALNFDFSQFDRDNMDRYLTVTYINQTNAVLPRILASPRAAEISNQLSAADLQAGNALAFYDSMNYRQAAFEAKAAYQKVMAAAAQINVQIEPQGAPADYRGLERDTGLDDRYDFRIRRRMP